MRLSKALALIASLPLALASASQAQAACALPYTITNGTPADATQVMANFNALADCIDGISTAVRELGPFAPPTASSFTFIETASSVKA